MTDSSTISGNPLLDEDSFQKLLAAAYVLQEHQDQQRAGEPETDGSSPQGVARGHQGSATSDYSQTLAQIVATQEQIQRSHLALPDAMSMIAEQTQFITHASGAAIGLREGDELLYGAASGTAKSLLGTRVSVNSCPSAECLNQDAIFYCPEVDTDSRVDAHACGQRGIKALIAVPIHQGGKIRGALEVHFATTNSFEEHDVRTCQLMAGMTAEALARAAQLHWKQALADERPSVLDAVQKRKPKLQRLTTDPEPSTTAGQRFDAAPHTIPTSPVSNAAVACPQCGSPLDAEQLFCGQCGSERPAANKLEIPRPWPSTGYSSQPADQEPVQVAEPEDDVFKAATKIFDVAQQPTVIPGVLTGDSAAIEAEKQASSAPPTSWVAETHSYPWSSAKKAKEWLQSRIGLRKAGTPERRVSRADVYLLLASVLAIAAISWAIWSHGNSPPGAGAPATATNPSSGAPASARQRKPPEPKLTATEKLLVWLGLAEPPDTPAYAGNPDTQVWVDMHTALYYCPGSDLYGKTSKGKYSSQRDAQMDQFEPAYRKACD